MSPLDLLYSWQSMFLALFLLTATQLFKGLVEFLIAKYYGGDGREKRRSSPANLALLPMFPLALGAILAWLAPIRPDYLVRYVTDNHLSKLVYAMWGASIGQFADYLYQRAKWLLSPPIMPTHTHTHKKHRDTPPAEDPSSTVE
jgi:hypothetical protein